MSSPPPVLISPPGTAHMASGLRHHLSTSPLSPLRRDTSSPFQNPTAAIRGKGKCAVEFQRKSKWGRWKVKTYPLIGLISGLCVSNHELIYIYIKEFFAYTPLLHGNKTALPLPSRNRSSSFPSSLLLTPANRIGPNLSAWYGGGGVPRFFGVEEVRIRSLLFRFSRRFWFWESGICRRRVESKLILFLSLVGTVGNL
jgi:hypothetical protein